MINKHTIHVFKSKLEDVECFKWNDKYHTSKNTSIQEKYITNIKKITNA